jgi:hypothetical protein
MNVWLEWIFMYNINFCTNVFGKRHVFHQSGWTAGVKGTNLLETRYFFPSSELSAKDQRKLSTPTSKIAPCAFMTTSNQHQFKNTNAKGWYPSFTHHFPWIRKGGWNI